MKARKYPELTALKGKLREEKLSYRELSRRTGISVNAINSKINGYTVFDLNEANDVIKESKIEACEIVRFFFPNMLRKVTLD